MKKNKVEIDRMRKMPKRMKKGEDFNLSKKTRQKERRK